MKNFLIFFLLILLVIVSSCNKKQEEVKINKQNPADSTALTGTASSVESTQKNKELSSAGDENIKTVTTGEVKNYINKNVVVRGYVADVAIREKVAYLNFDKKYPKNTFSAVVFSEKFSEVGDLNIYKNKNVEVTGTISTYKDKPQIIVTSKNQIQTVK
jgi:hypothetical protein